MPTRSRPFMFFAVLALAGCALFTSLGFWQWNRGQHRAAVWAAFAAAGEPVAVTAETLSAVPRFERVRVEGRLEPQRQFLLDNLSHAGRPGYQVLAPLRLADGSLLLVNRGWLPFSGYRDRLPDVAFPVPPPGALTGRLDRLPTPGLASGRAPPPQDGAWPRVTTFPTVAEIGAALGEPVREPVLLLDDGVGPGFLRDWQPPGVPPERNFSYAVQWWAFAVLSLVLLAVMSSRRAR